MSRAVTIPFEDTIPVLFAGDHFADLTFSGTVDVLPDPSREQGFRLILVEFESFDEDGYWHAIEPGDKLFESFEAYADRKAEAIRLALREDVEARRAQMRAVYA